MPEVKLDTKKDTLITKEVYDSFGGESNTVFER